MNHCKHHSYHHATCPNCRMKEKRRKDSSSTILPTALTPIPTSDTSSSYTPDTSSQDNSQSSSSDSFSGGGGGSFDGGGASGSW